MKSVLCLACFLLAVAASAQVLVPPERPIVATTEIGEVALESGRLQVLVSATVSTNQLTAFVGVEKGSPPVRVLTVDPQEIPALCQLVEQAAIAAAAQKSFAGTAGRLKAKCLGGPGSDKVVLVFQSEGVVPQQVRLDASGARQLARALAQGKATADWLLAKLKTIQPDTLPR